MFFKDDLEEYDECEDEVVDDVDVSDECSDDSDTDLLSLSSKESGAISEPFAESLLLRQELFIS